MGRAAAVWARGPPEAWFMSFGMGKDKPMSMVYAKDFQNPWVLRDLITRGLMTGTYWSSGTLGASQVCTGVRFATERLGAGGQRRGRQTLTWMTLAHVQEFRELQGPGVIRDNLRLWGAPGGTMTGCRRSPHAPVRGPSPNPPPLPRDVHAGRRNFQGGEGKCAPKREDVCQWQGVGQGTET